VDVIEVEGSFNADTPQVGSGGSGICATRGEPGGDRFSAGTIVMVFRSPFRDACRDELKELGPPGPTRLISSPRMMFL